LKDSTEYLAATVADCTQKDKDFNARQKSRAEEITAIGEAISIMKSDEVQKGSGNLDSAQSVGSLIQLKATSEDPDRLVEFLKQRGTSIGSKILMQLAEVAAADPFVKIRKMIQELITKMQEEAKAELEKKGMCDKQMAENKAKTEEFTEKVAKLTSEVEMLTGEVAELTATKKRLTKEVAATKKALATATSERASEKAENERVISESTAASSAIEQAMSVLQSYYSKVEGAFVQVSQPAFDGGKYEGMGGGGVLGLLEVIKSQMDQLIRETTQAEADAASSFADFKKVSEVSIAEKTTLKQSTSESLTQKKEDLTDAKDTLAGPEGAQAMLDSYIKEKKEVIDPVCIAKGVSFEERDKKRQEEIQSLQEALEILSQL